jgi:hypothetical protein
MSITLLDNADLWDRFVDESPYGMLFHRWKFLQILEKYSGFKVYPYGMYRGNELVCVFPLFYRAYGGLRMVFSPPPGVCVPYLGPVMSPLYDGLRQRKKESYLNAAIDEIQGQIAKFSPHYTSFNAVPGFEDIRPFKWAGYDVAVSHTYILDISGPIDKVWEGFDANCKKGIRTCGSQEVTLKQTHDSRKFYDITRERFKGMGLSCPIPGADYLTEIINTFPENARMYFLYADDEIAYIALNTEYKGRLMFWLGEINIRTDIACNEYAKWEFIRDASSRGFTEVELEGATMKQLCMFKSRFNPALRHNYLIYRKGAIGNIAEWAYRNFVMKSIRAT